MTLFETPRLYVRRLVKADAEAMAAIYDDDTVTQVWEWRTQT